MQGGLQQNTAISSCKALNDKTQFQEMKFQDFLTFSAVGKLNK